ncbi:MAG: deoxyribose-phosphate aldolase [Candidatus Bathyarchaeota archaeon]|nr:deoxyribose-phosphate aldolase [Candidatus Bathyarchaeota archaeon]MDH5779110.1 deoxyribose-phosphate aldolase [Candidatus Bathyarchaeota archaeon]
MKISKKQLAKIIDHTLVKPTATKGAIIKLCREAEKYSFGCVCVNSAYVSLAVQLLEGMDVKVCSTVGFPFGANLAEVKAFEAKRAVENGASEVDMVINIGALKSGDYEKVKEDIKAVVDVKRLHGDVFVKVIIETGYLTDEEKAKACKLAKEAGADFVKTATGLVGGATAEDVRLLHKTVGGAMGVKAAGGIRDFEQALAMIEAGANRIGTSTAVAIMETFADTTE